MFFGTPCIYFNELSRNLVQFKAYLRRPKYVSASIEIVTVSPSDDEPEGLEADVPTLTVAEVSKSSGDEGEDGADDERDELDKIEAEERKSQQGDDRVVNEEVPSLEDAGEEEDEFTSMWRKLQPDRGQVNLVKENRRKIWGRIEVIWLELRLVIMEAFENHGGMLYSEEEHQESSRNWRLSPICPSSWSSGWSCYNSLPWKSSSDQNINLLKYIILNQ